MGPVPPPWAVALAAVLGAAVTADVLVSGTVIGWDHAISHVMRHWGVRFDPWPMRFTYLLTLPGQRGTVLVLTGPTVAWLAWRSRSSLPVVRWVVALVLLTVSVYGLKEATARLAPPVDGLHTATGASFPSGHVANAVIVWGAVAFSAAQVSGAPGWLRRTLRVLVVAAPVSAAVGMTILDYHWLSDFVVAACLGVVVLRLVELDAWSVPARWIDGRLPGRPRAAR